MMGDGWLHVSCYAEPNKLMTCLQKEGKRARLVHWQYGEARTEGCPSSAINFTLDVDEKDRIMVEKLLKILAQGAIYSILVQKKDNGWYISGCSEPKTFMKGLREAETISHLVHWRECATNLCQNSFYHEDKARRVEYPSFVNYSDY
nr:hypothetical protein [Tanacetum cinerariifolium]